MRSILLVLLHLTAFSALGASGAAGEDARGMPVIGIGYEWSGPSGTDQILPLPMIDPVASRENPLWFRIEVHWGVIEKQPGRYDWAALDNVVDRFRARSHEVVLNLWGGNSAWFEDILRSPGAAEPAAMGAWEAFVREAVRHFKGRVRFWQIGRSPDDRNVWGQADPVKSYAFLLKKSAVLVRAEDKDAVIVTGGLSGVDAAWLARFFAEGVAPYVEVVSFRPDARFEIGAQVRAFVEAAHASGAAPSVWLEGVGPAGSSEDAGRSMVRQLLSAFDAGASAVLFATPYGETGTPQGGAFLARTHSALAAGSGRVPFAGRVAFEDSSGAPIPGVTVVSFYAPEEGISATGYWADAEGSPGTAKVKITARRPGPPILFDPITGLQTRPEFGPDTGGIEGEVLLGSSPLLLLYREGVGATPPSEGSESLAVSAARGITADEVIAKYNEFQTAQNDRLKHWSADALINYNFRLGGGNRTIDVGMQATYFFDPVQGAEWEIEDYYLEGLKAKWKEFPEIPFIQPEKVMTLPLDITFDRSYHYEYAGEDRVEGRDCHVLSFEPVDPTQALYRGKVWIDKTTWARVRVDSRQTALEPPFLSNEETSTFAPVKAPDGEDLWVLSRIDGQQIYSVVARSIVVLRRVVFSNHRINSPDFDESRQQAYASNNQMMRDTDKGLRYLEKTPDGGRAVKADFNTNQLFALGGAIYDPSLHHVYPLVGINYFDYDFQKMGIQTNLFFAGLLANLNVTKPDIGRSGLDLGGTLDLSALKRTDMYFSQGEEISEQDVDRREQSLGITLQRQVGSFVTLRTEYDLLYEWYGSSEGTDSAYILPASTFVQTISLFGTFNRSGYEARANGTYAVRSNFEFWGNPCQQGPAAVPGTTVFYLADPPDFCTPAASTAHISDPQKRARERQKLQDRKDLLAGDDYNPKGSDYYLYSVAGVKEFFLPNFQKLRFAAEFFGGQDLDRFSRYTFDRLGTPLRGFSGSGIRFDEGGIVRAAYLFDLTKFIRFEAGLEQARVREKQSGASWDNYTGIGIAGSTLGPWKTIWSLEYGYALRSSIASTQGNQEFFFLVLKLF